MKGIKAQIAVALVCILLGFLITYQIKLLNKNDKIANVKDQGNTAEYVAEIERLKKEIDKIEKENNGLMDNIKAYENMAKNVDYSSKLVKDQLDHTRVLLGLVDVQGPGVLITISPKNSLFMKNDLQYFIMDNHLMAIVNELKVREAEAISINDKRIVNQSGIKSSSNNSYILINNEKVSPRAKIEIRAIGQKANFTGMQEFIKGLDFNIVTGYEIKIEEMSSIKLPKYNKSHIAGHFTVEN